MKSSKSAGERSQDPAHQQPSGERSRHPQHRSSRPHPRGSDPQPQRRSQPRDLPKHKRKEERRSQPQEKDVSSRERRHTQQPTVTCPICPTTFRGDRASGRDKHLAREHSLSLQWACKFCPKQVGAARFRDLARHCANVHKKKEQFHVPMYSKLSTEGREVVVASTTGSQQPAAASSSTAASQPPASTFPAVATASQQKQRRVSPRHHSQPAARGPSGSHKKRPRDEEATPQTTLPKRPYQRGGRPRSPSGSSSSSGPPASSGSDRPHTPESTPPQPSSAPDTSTPESGSTPTSAAVSPVVDYPYENITPVTSMNLSQGSDLLRQLINAANFSPVTPPKELATTGTAITPPTCVDATTNTRRERQHTATQTDGAVVVMPPQGLQLHVQIFEPHRTTGYNLQCVV